MDQWMSAKTSSLLRPDSANSLQPGLSQLGFNLYIGPGIVASVPFMLIRLADWLNWAQIGSRRMARPASGRTTSANLAASGQIKMRALPAELPAALEGAPRAGRS